MRLSKVLFLSVLLFVFPLFGDSTNWGRDALKLQHSVNTLNTLMGVNPFPDEAPGMVTAIGQKTDQLIGDLAALNASLANELPDMSADERSDALHSCAALLVQIADAGQMLADRSLTAIVSALGTAYNVSYYSYNSLSGQYGLAVKSIPIYVVVGERGGWPIPG
jgi:hypothetical protein